MHFIDGSQKDYTEIVFFPTAFWELSCSLVSTITTFLVIVLCIISGFYKTHTGRIVVWINFADFLYSGSKAIHALVRGKSNRYCMALQLMSGYGLISSIISSALFGQALFRILKTQCTTVSERTMKIYILIGVILPLAEPVASYFTKFTVYSQELDTCVHRVYHGHLDYSFIFQRYIPFAFVCTFSIAFYLQVVFTIKTIFAEVNSRELWGFLAYPAIVILCWLPHLTLDIVLSLNYNVHRLIVSIVVMNGQLQGFWDALAYGLSKKVRESLKEICCTERKLSEVSAGSCSNTSHTDSEIEYVEVKTDDEWPAPKNNK